MKRVLNLGTLFVNTYLVEIKEGWVLVDTGYPSDYEHFLKKAKKNGIDLTSIRYVVLTHVHADHAGFLKRILEDTGASLICLPSEKERLASGVNEKNVYLSRPWLFLVNRISASLSRYQTFEPVDITGAIDPETQPLAGEGVTFFVLHGHTDNDLCFLVEDKLFVGDVAMNGIAASGHSPIWIEDNDALVQSWRELLSMAGNVIYPGHGNPFPKAELAAYVEKQKTRKLCKLFK